MHDFALLDDNRSEGTGSRLYQQRQAHLSCHEINALPAFLSHVEQQLRQGCYTIILWSYELGEALYHITSRPASTPFAEALIFSECQHLTQSEVDDWLIQQQPTSAQIFNTQPSVDQSAFTDAIDRIHAYIEAGDCYQVNYTFRTYFKMAGDPLALYQQLRQRQPVSYGAYIPLPDGRLILSRSPELFVAHHQQQLTARPMKGTAKAHPDSTVNQHIQDELHHDPKNQAENVMIVDLLRNDLGRVAQSGSVEVTDLFKVTQYGQVWQMTSTVNAIAPTHLSLSTLINAIFPCGSITGAPKLRTMQIIRELETTPRQLYTGAIGWLDPLTTTKQLPDFCLSVPIRTLLLSPEQQGIRQGEMGIGAGIVYDSQAQSEYEECLVKGQFLTELAMTIDLIETMLVTKETGYRHLSEHITRLSHSAKTLGFIYDQARIEQQLIQHQVNLPPKTRYRARLLLSPTGEITITSQPFTPSVTPVKIFLAAQTVPYSPLLAHKTTDRAIYNATLNNVLNHQGFDALFFNDKGELTEGCRSNVFVRVDGRWYTPPISCGLLPGIMRQCILDDDNWQAIECVITREELLTSTQIMVCNDLHGPLFVHLDQSVMI